jgi:uncharacterized coiled-coil DUF342 family protein
MQLNQLRPQLEGATSQIRRKQEQLDSLRNQVQNLRKTARGHEGEMKVHLETIEELQKKVGHLHDMAMQPRDVTRLRVEVLRLRAQLQSPEQ